MADVKELDLEWIKRTTGSDLGVARFWELCGVKYFYVHNPKKGEARYNKLIKRCVACGKKVMMMAGYSRCGVCRKKMRTETENKTRRGGEEYRHSMYGVRAEWTPAPDPRRKWRLA